MGCGSGAAGLVLAEEGADVVGVDIHQPFLDAFERKARERGVAGRVSTRLASMVESGIEKESLDLVWSEGAVFTVGFDAALRAFRALLKPGGLVVVSECVWLREDPPDELRDYWAEGYPGMRDARANVRAAEAMGYGFLHAETLPDEVWETEFYRPIEAVIANMGPDTSPEIMSIAREQEAEIALFRRYRGYFGYAFLAFAKG